MSRRRSTRQDTQWSSRMFFSTIQRKEELRWLDIIQYFHLLNYLTMFTLRLYSFNIYLLLCKDFTNISFNLQHCFNPEVVPFPGISQAKDGWYLGSWWWELGDAPAIPRCASRPAQHSQAVHGRVQHLPTINLWRVCSSDQEYPCLSLILPLDQCHNGGESLPRWISKFNLFRNLISIWQPVMFHLH